MRRNPVDPRSAGFWRVGVLLVALLAAGLLTGCSGEPDSTEVPVAQVRDGGTLRLAVESLPETFNRYRAPAFSGIESLLEPTTGSAVRVLPDGSWEVDPTYASAVEVVSAAPLTVAVTLNPQGVWSDGRSIDAADMVAFVAAQQGQGGQRTTADGWGVVQAVQPGADPYSYSVVFAAATPDWPAFVYPGLPAEATTPEAYAGFADTAPPSNGPFVIEGIDRAAGRVTYVRNPRWWGTTPKLDGLTVEVASAADQGRSFADGDLDAVLVDASNRDAIGATGRRLISTGTIWSQVTLNAGQGVLADPVVRRAVAGAIDRSAFAESPDVLVSSVLKVPGQVGYRAATPDWPSGPDDAGAALESVGWVLGPDGVRARADGARLSLDAPYPADNPANRERVDRLTTQLARVGVEVVPREVPAAEFFTGTVVALDFDLVTFVWEATAFDVADVVARYTPIDSRSNVTGLGDSTVASLGAQLLAAADPDPAVADAFDAAVFASAVTVPLGLEARELAVRDNVVNLKPRQFGSLDWTRVGLRG